MPGLKRSFFALFTTLLVTACTLPQSTPRSQPEADLVLVTAALDATATPTPFQPGGGLTQSSAAPRQEAPVPAGRNPPLDFTVVDHVQAPALIIEMASYNPVEAVQAGVSCGAPAGWVAYTVQAGDTLSLLSQIHGISIAALQSANCLSGTALLAGQIIHVPHPYNTTPIQIIFNTATPTLTFTKTNTAGPSQTASATRSGNTAIASPSRTPTSTRAANPETHTATRTPSATRVSASATAVTADPHLTTTTTVTSTPSATPTFTVSPVPPTATATSRFNQPGFYIFNNLCVVIELPEPFVTVDECLVSAQVFDDGVMRFDLSWTAHLAGSEYEYVEKNSDAGNTYIYVTDDVGNRYDFFALWGLAAQSGYLADNETGYGSYFFPPAMPGATTFTFNDDGLGAVFFDIVFTH